MNETKETPSAGTSELLPCPFCGRDEAGIEARDSAQAHCRWCDAYGPFARTPEDAAKGWNERAAAPAVSSACNAGLADLVKRMEAEKAFRTRLWAKLFGLTPAHQQRLAGYQEAIDDVARWLNEGS